MKKSTMIFSVLFIAAFASAVSAQNLRIKEIHNLFSDDLGERERTLYQAMGSGGGFFYNPVWSPNGSKIAFDFSVYDEPTSIWVVNSDGTGLQKISNKNDEHPSWSPDGSRIAFLRYNSILDKSEIWVMNADGTNQTFLTSGVDPDWAPTGKIAFIERGPEGFPDIWWINSDGSELTRVISSPESKGDPSWSPDGNWIVFFQIKSGSGNLWVIGSDGNGLRQLTAKGGQRPSWSPDAKWIAFVSERWRGKADIWAVRADKKEDVVHLRTGAESADRPAWSPDGKRIAFDAVYKFKVDEGLFVMTLQ